MKLILYYSKFPGHPLPQYLPTVGIAGEPNEKPYAEEKIVGQRLKTHRNTYTHPVSHHAYSIRATDWSGIGVNKDISNSKIGNTHLLLLGDVMACIQSYLKCKTFTSNIFSFIPNSLYSLG